MLISTSSNGWNQLLIPYFNLRELQIVNLYEKQKKKEKEKIKFFGSQGGGHDEWRWR